MDIKLLEDLTNAFGPPGHETAVQHIFKEYGEKFSDEILFDKLGSVIHKKGSLGPKIMIAGHADEIGFVITEIDKSGFLRIHNLGGWWAGNIISHQLEIRPSYNDENILGIVVNKPPHVLKPEERTKLVPIKNLYVDIGCSSKIEVKELGIRVGDPAVPYSKFRQIKRTKTINKDEKEKKIEKNLVVAKALDNRIGIFIVLEVLKRIKENNIDHPNQIYFVSTTQEEVGVRGAKTSSHLIQPDIGFAIDVDVSGDVPGINVTQKMSEGVVISAGDALMIPNPKLRKFAIDQAEINDIKWQPAYLAGGGTDASVMHTTGIGAPSLFIGIATRHIHSHHGILDLDDVEKTIQLLVNIITNLDETTVKSFTQI